MKKAPNLYAVILAGGSGTRFWPMSRQARPKQFLRIHGKGSFFEQTLSRVKGKVLKENVFIVTNTHYKTLVRSQSMAFKIPTGNILLEPQSRNTAPAVGWVASRIYSLNPQALMVVLPSDHLILHKDAFLKHIDEAIELAEGHNLVAFGIVPTRPETGYGYLKTEEIQKNGKTVLKVQKFVEKPPLERAEEFISDNNYFWNSGMFVWKVVDILSAIKEFLPKIDQAFRKGHSQAYAQKIWKKLPAVSVDYGVLENAHNVMAVGAENIGWSDVGSWQALYDVSIKNPQSSVLKGDVIAIDCERIFVQGHKKLIAAIGLKGIAIVDTPDALLVCQTKDSQKVREVIAQLKKKKRKEI